MTAEAKSENVPSADAEMSAKPMHEKIDGITALQDVIGKRKKAGIN